jgi:glycosyltransferase involved in cell wall biosynthesis
MQPEPPTPEAIRAQADQARDARNWAAAEHAYRAYLAERPRHWEIHVQLGHAVKEQGDVEGALAQYRRAIALAPQAADPHLQAGHALRLLGRGAEAAEAMQAAFALEPANPLLRREVALTRHRRTPPDEAPALPRPAPEGPPTQLAFDVTDLLDYLRDARTPTGIQRVQMGFLGALLARAERPVPLLLVCYDPSAWRWWHVEEAAFRRVLALARIGAREDEPAWRTATAALVQPDLRPEAPLADGCTLASLGNAWGIEDYFRGLRLLRASVALRYVAFLHDCVPLAMPEHCLDLTVRLYARWFSALSLQADALLANSQATAADRARFMAALPRQPPLTVVPLAVEPPPPAAAAAAAAAALPVPLPGEAFVLFVATIESRKNHLLVFQAWLDLVRRLGADAVPRLVCVGRPGWQAEPALTLWQRSPELRRKVEFVTGVSDLALAGLTSRCLFSVYNSYHEGWGLPVSESLAAGKLAVVPAHSGLLESGAQGAVFFPGQDRPALVEVLARLITDAPHRAALEARIDRAAAGRSFAIAAEDLLRALMAPAPAPPAPPPLPTGRHLPLGVGAARSPSAELAWAEAMRLGLGWWWPEPDGVWTRDGVATLHLPAELPAGAALRVLLHLRAPPRGITLRLRLRGAAEGPWQRLVLGPGERLSCVLQGAAGPQGAAVDLDAGDGDMLGDRAKRRVGVALTGLMLCREDDLAARIAALERAAG